MQELTVVCPDIECEACASAIKRSVAKMEGVTAVAVDVASKTVTVDYDPKATGANAISVRLEAAGFRPE